MLRNHQLFIGRHYVDRDPAIGRRYAASMPGVLGGIEDGVIHHAVEGHALITYEDDSSRASGHESSRLACPTATSSRGQADYIMLAPHDDDGAHVGAV